MRRLAVALVLLAAPAAAGCGKSNLAPTTSASTPVVSVAKAPTESTPGAPPQSTPGAPTHSTPGAPTQTTPGAPTQSTPGAPGQTSTVAPGRKPPAARAPKVPGSSAVPVPLPLTAARAAAFAHAVQLTTSDVPGAHEAPASKTPSAREREAAQCGGHAAPTIGSGHSRELQRGQGLERETISSSVEILRDAHSVEKNLSGSKSTGGLRCYERVLARSLQSEADPNIKLLGVSVAPLQVSVAGAGRAQGLRILARVGVPGAGAVVRLFVDAVTLPYGPAEIDLFGTSFVQPVAERTEQELLTLLHQRALAQKL
jgi:hypothetical protein